ncbi:MAG: sugar transferase [Oscillospiraceae bacterium]|nr:sugar transferase [Oscillospiraceae bacterium]
MKEIENVSLEMRWHIADKLSAERLPEVNQKVQPVHARNTFYVRYVKRGLDFLIALVVLILTLPINLLIGIITLFDVGRPIFFLQERSGMNEKPFNLIKFRNMRNTVDEHGALLPADKRVTKWGRFVRKTSLDELLNFVSILKGDMSIIGPRPLPVQYLSRYNARHRERLKVRPGLECPPLHAEVMRNWQDQFENDVWYVENVSFMTDCKMIWRLIKFTFDRKNSTKRGQAGRSAFMGYSCDGVAICLDEVPKEMIVEAYQSIYGEDASSDDLTAGVV